MRKIKIEKYQAQDFELYFELTKDDDVMKYITGKGMTAEEAHKKFDFFLELNSKDEALGYFKVFEHEFHIGDGKLVNYANDPLVFEMGYLVSKSYWNQGYGTLICQKLLELAHKLNPKKDIIGIIAAENLASKKLLLKFGFEPYFSGTEDGWDTEKLILKKS